MINAFRDGNIFVPTAHSTRYGNHTRIMLLVHVLMLKCQEIETSYGLFFFVVHEYFPNVSIKQYQTFMFVLHNIKLLPYIVTSLSCLTNVLLIFCCALGYHPTDIWYWTYRKQWIFFKLNENTSNQCIFFPILKNFF